MTDEEIRLELLRLAGRFGWTAEDIVTYARILARFVFDELDPIEENNG